MWFAATEEELPGEQPANRLMAPGETRIFEAEELAFLAGAKTYINIYSPTEGASVSFKIYKL